MHEFKMSVCEIIYSESDKHFEVKAYLFMDDVTEAITGDPKAPLPNRDQLVQYVQKHFSLQVDGQAQTLQFYALRQKEEQVLLHFTAPALGKSPASVTVKDDLLIEKFSEQTNMVYLIVPGHNKKVEALDKKKTQVAFSL
jgi:hypothetical protein